MPERFLEYVWNSDATAAKLARVALAPAGWLFRAGVAARNAAYDRGRFPTYALALPAICVGNLSLGGTGKTPVAAWMARRLRDQGATPAIVLRGYGGDEALVHERLNPDIRVIADADRVRGVARARESGATVAVLDDGFQHRRARRDADVVLLSADDAGVVRPLPAGPWREPLSALTRATLIVVTRKYASMGEAEALLARARRHAPLAAGAIMALSTDELVDATTGERAPVRSLAGHDVLAISAIGNPRAFEAQLRALGARVSSASYPDHHRFTVAEVALQSRRARGHDWVVCTLKDAVKLANMWPRATSPLWYLSQRISVEAGGAEVDHLLARLALPGAPHVHTTPAVAGPNIDGNAS